MDLPNYKKAVISLYDQRNQLPPNAQSALYWQPLETVLAFPASRLQTWTENGYAYFYQQMRAAKWQAALQTPDIWQYFRPTTQPHQDLQPPWETLLHCPVWIFFVRISHREITL